MILNSIIYTLHLNGKIFERQFNFLLEKELFSLTELLQVQILKDYIQANNTVISKGDKIKLSVVINGIDKGTVFDGVVFSNLDDKKYYRITAESNLSAFLNEKAIAKSFVDTTPKAILDELIPSQFDCSVNLSLSRFVIQPMVKKSVIHSLFHLVRTLALQKEYYYLDGDKLIYTANQPNTVHDVTSAMIRVSRFSLVLFPMPEIKIYDQVFIHDKLYTVHSFSLSNRRLVLGIVEAV